MAKFIFMYICGCNSAAPQAAPERESRPETVDAKTVAKWAGISRDRVYELVRTKQLPAIRVGTLQIRFNVDDVRAFLKTVPQK